MRTYDSEIKEENGDWRGSVYILMQHPDGHCRTIVWGWLIQLQIQDFPEEGVVIAKVECQPLIVSKTCINFFKHLDRGGGLSMVPFLGAANITNSY